MFKSSDVACLKPTNFKNKSCILGIEKSFLPIHFSKNENKTNSSIVFRNYIDWSYPLRVIFTFFCTHIS